MKNTIKILCLIQLATFSLSSWGGPLPPARLSPTPIENRLEEIRINNQIEPNNTRNTQHRGLDGSAEQLIQQKIKTRSDSSSENWKSLKSVQEFEELKEQELNKLNPQKEEFIKSGAIECQGRNCQVTPAGHHLLNAENTSNYVQKFKDFCKAFNLYLNLQLPPYELYTPPQPAPSVIPPLVKQIVDPTVAPKPKPAPKPVVKKSIGQQLLAWMVKSLNIETKKTRIIDFTGETSPYSRLKSEDKEALKEIAEQPKCPKPSCFDVVKSSLYKMKEQGVEDAYITAHSKGNILKRNYDKTDETINPIDLIKYGQKMNINVHIVACNTGLNAGIGGFKVPVSLAKVINYAKENAEVLTAEEFQKGFTKIHGEGNFVTSIYNQERFEPDNDSGEPNIPLPQKFANELNESIISATVDVQNKKTRNHQNYKLIYPTSKTNQSTYIEEKENMNDTH